MRPPDSRRRGRHEGTLNGHRRAASRRRRALHRHDALLGLVAAGLAASNFVFNTILMRRPVSGEPLAAAAYFRGTVRDHFWGVAGGMIWGAGMTLSIIAFGVAGPAISYGLGQGATKVAAVDTTAAGDAFTGALATAVGGGATWLAAVHQAVAAGALDATRLGAQPSLPNRAEWEAFLADNREV
jgi:hypothetical protein